jgi:UDP-2-acetamido-2,6-beta-L-arabino-hexul-4-ose reductase
MTFLGHHILVTGSNGFVGKNLLVRLKEFENVKVSTFERGDSPDDLLHLIPQVDAIVHLAGENRPIDHGAYKIVNTDLTRTLCDAVKRTHAKTGQHVPIVFASSTQAIINNSYGRSKLAAEKELKALSEATDNPTIVFRFPSIFGKWCKPNYNSVVATFCFNIARDLPIRIHDPEKVLKLVYIDDVLESVLNSLVAPDSGYGQMTVQPEYNVTLGQLAEHIRSFANFRFTLNIERVGNGFMRALYASYVSYLPEDMFSHQIAKHQDPRGVFVEMLKTPDSGQFSYFTAKPGVTRGGHYHHTKTEKFLVIKGEALFRFRHLLTDKLIELHTSGSIPEIVDTIPGWAHDISNVGEDELIVMLWANENFDPKTPDTNMFEVSK